MNDKKSMTVAERQRASRARRGLQTCDTFSAQQISIMLSAPAAKALRMLASNCDMSQKDVIERLLIEAYDIAKNSD